MFRTSNPNECSIPLVDIEFFEQDENQNTHCFYLTHDGASFISEAQYRKKETESNDYQFQLSIEEHEQHPNNSQISEQPPSDEQHYDLCNQCKQHTSYSLHNQQVNQNYWQQQNMSNETNVAFNFPEKQKIQIHAKSESVPMYQCQFENTQNDRHCRNYVSEQQPFQMNNIDDVAQQQRFSVNNNCDIVEQQQFQMNNVDDVAEQQRFRMNINCDTDEQQEFRMNNIDDVAEQQSFEMPHDDHTIQQQRHRMMDNCDLIERQPFRLGNFHDVAQQQQVRMHDTNSVHRQLHEMQQLVEILQTKVNDLMHQRL